MEKTYDELIELINNWKKFKEENNNGDLSDFGRWLNKEDKSQSTFGQTERFIIRRANEMKQKDQSASVIAGRAIIGSLLGRLTLFVKNYTKIPFQELGLGSMDEFKILSMIDRMKNPNKSNLSHAALMEFTTINDMLKRFEKKGWVKQEKDEADKRASRMRLTGKGDQFLKKIYRTLAGIQPSLTGDLSDEEQQQLMGLLMRLNHFHTNYFESHFNRKGISPK